MTNMINRTANKIAMLNIFVAVICVLLYSPIFFVKVGPYITSALLIKSAVEGCLLVVILASTAIAFSSSSRTGMRRVMVLLNGILILLAAYDCAKLAYFRHSVWSYYLGPSVILLMAILNIQAFRRLSINVR